MSSFLSENLNERETVHDGPTRLNGWDMTNTGTEDRFVGFVGGDERVTMIVVPAGGSKDFMGLNEPYPEGLSVESLTGDGTLVINVFYEEREAVVASLGLE